jgi:DNA-directed RNA polymerase specialized sigma24 family protein
VAIYLDDKRLVKQLLARDAQALDAFFNDNFARLYRFALARLSDDPDGTREVVQITLTKAIQKLHTYRGEAALFIGTFASVNARISRCFRVGRRTITAFFEVANIFDRNNQCCRDFDLADDTDDVLELSDDYWLPRHGFLWEFQ